MTILDETKPKHAAATPAPAHTVACNGAFTKDSSHMKLATAFGSQNVTWDDVDGPGGSKLKATVLFPKDPKRRLEVLEFPVMTLVGQINDFRAMLAQMHNKRLDQLLQKMKEDE